MKKILVFMFLMAFGLILVACLETGNGDGNGNGNGDGNGDGNGNGDEEPIAEEIFNEKLLFLEDNNYELEIKITDHQALADSIVNMYFDGTTVKYEDADYVAFYDNSGSKSKMYVKEGDTYSVTESSFNTAGLFYYDFEFEQFTLNGETTYILKSSAYDSLDTFIGLEESVTSISNLQFRVNDIHITEVIFDVMVGETVYLVTLTISNVGQVELVLPTV